MLFVGKVGARVHTKGHGGTFAPNLTAKHQSAAPYFTLLSAVSGDERRMTRADIEV